MKSKIKIFKVTELELVTCRQPLNTWTVAHLFYGVPNDFEGELFMKLFKRFLNPKFKYYRQFRKRPEWFRK